MAVRQDDSAARSTWSLAVELPQAAVVHGTIRGDSLAVVPWNGHAFQMGRFEIIEPGNVVVFSATITTMVPEPSTRMLLGVAMLSMLCIGQKRSLTRKF